MLVYQRCIRGYSVYVCGYGCVCHLLNLSNVSSCTRTWHASDELPVSDPYRGVKTVIKGVWVQGLPLELIQGVDVVQQLLPRTRCVGADGESANCWAASCDSESQTLLGQLLYGISLF